jgi:hypothetical protein
MHDHDRRVRKRFGKRILGQPGDLRGVGHASNCNL